ncbi:MAG: sigma-70 family RNA polymerase sigma factor [Candidatus Kerfeldbacteria bacterium]|nr:sigma-70 family RNA polymerase sigma factor [Candidatus Kerfeldbacteria bacterium]
MTRQEEKFLVAKAQSDPKQFEVLYRTFIDEIYRFIFYKTSQKEVAEDLTAQVFMHALEHLADFQYQPGARFTSWLYAIARNQVIDHYRKYRPVSALEDVAEISIVETASATVDQQLHQQQVQSILKLLSSTDQEILKLRLWQEKSYSDIAAIVQLNVVTVRARYSRALKKFTKFYTKRYGTSY